MEERRLFEQAPYKFTREELEQLSQEHARAQIEYAELKNHRSNVVADLGNQLKLLQTRISELATRIHSGEELRPVECIVMLDTPKPGLKQILRLDNNEPLRTEPMSEAEQQQSFAFPEGQDSKPPEEQDDPES